MVLSWSWNIRTFSCKNSHHWPGGGHFVFPASMLLIKCLVVNWSQMGEAGVGSLRCISVELLMQDSCRIIPFYHTRCISHRLDKRLSAISLLRAGSGLVRIDPLRFLAGCRTRRLNHVCPLSHCVFYECVCCAVNYMGSFCLVLCCVICVFCLLVVLVRLSVPVQVIDWKDSSPKWPVICWWGRETLYSLTHRYFNFLV